MQKRIEKIYEADENSAKETQAALVQKKAVLLMEPFESHRCQLVVKQVNTKPLRLVLGGSTALVAETVRVALHLAIVTS